MGSLSNLYISQSYTSLVHLGNDGPITSLAPGQFVALQDGLGNSLKIELNSSGDVNIGGILSASNIPTDIATQAELNAYTQSTNIRLNNIESTTASLNISVTNLNASSASQQVSINALNVFTASQSTASINTSITNLNLFTQSANVRLNNLESTSASVNISISNLNSATSSFATSIANLNSNSASVNTSINNLNASSASQQISINALSSATSSYVTETESGSFLLTASFDNGTRNLTFTKGNNTTFNVNIPDVSGSTGNFATTGSNQFIGNQAIDGTLTITGKIIGSQSIILQPDANDIRTLEIYNTSATDTHITASGGNLFLGNDETYVLVTTYGNQKLVTVRGDQGITASGSLDISGSLTSSLQQGYVWVGNASGRTITVPTSSFGGGATLPSGLLSSSVTNFVDYSASVDSRINGIVVGSGFATLGANTFTGSQNILNANLIINNTGSAFLTMNAATQSNILFNSPSNTFTSFGGFNFNNNGGAGGSGSLQFSATSASISYYSRDGFIFGRITPEAGPLGNGFIKMNTFSGSLVIAPSGFNVAATDLLHLSASSNSNFVNLVFKNSNTAADTIISGSNNIFTNPAAPTAGFKRYMTGGNIAVGGNGVAIPQISGSMAFSPTIANNYFGVSANPITLRGPVSSSAYTINNNVLAGGAINLGTSAATNFERAVSGLSSNNNFIAGTLNAIASKTQLSASVSIVSNNIAGTVNLNMDSSSISLQGNIVQGTLNVNNSYFPATTGIQLASSVQGGLFLGNSTIFISGSNTTFTGAPGRTITNTVMLGLNNVLSASLNGDLAQVASTTMIGQGLVVVGSNSRALAASAADWGSVFVGRWNAIDGTKDQTAETVFAVGTGTAEGSRKTAFLIDSGSNTFVEGTLNVSGSTSLTGSLTIQSGSSFFANGNKQFNVGAFQSNVSQSGSANVSQSMNFEVTDISSGVSIASNSRITLANSGTYNIQFSAQIDRVSGSGTDTIHIWLKKNGTNVSATAGAVTISGGAAAAKTIAAWNYVVDAVANDYYELCWESTDNRIQLINQAAGGNIPSTPSIILTVTQVR